MLGLNLDPINFIGAAVALALLYQSFRLVRERKESVFEFLVWSTFGMGLLVYSLSRTVTIQGSLESFELFLQWLGFGGGIDGMFVLAILGLLLMLFYTYTNAKTNRQKIYDINQEVALLKYQVGQESKEEDPDRDNNHDSVER